MADFYWRVQFLLSPTIGNPDVFWYHTQPSVNTNLPLSVVPVWTNISRRFFLRFRNPVSLSKLSSSHSVTVILLIFVTIFENSTDLTSFHCVVRFVVVVTVQLRCLTVLSFVRYFRTVVGLTSFNSPFALFRVSCVVVEFHSSRSSLLIFVYIYENSTSQHRFRQL